jgi:hypothetical protein
MFCFQCEQTAKGEGCTKIGVCGKQPDVAALQDLMIYVVKGLSQVALAGRKAGVKDPRVDRFTCEAIFSTLTNVDFDPDRFVAMIHEGVQLRDRLKADLAIGGHVPATGPAGLCRPRAARSWWPRASRWVFPRPRRLTPISAACASCWSTASKAWPLMPTMRASSGRKTTRFTSSFTRAWPPPWMMGWASTT